MTAELDGPLSVPRRFVTPRPLTESELCTLRAVADALIPAAGDNPAATQEPGLDDMLVTAAHARADAFVEITEALATLRDLTPADLDTELRRLHAEDEGVFQPLSAVVAGAWLLLPTVRARIGYAGQKADPAPLELAVDEISSGILDDVLERGPIFRPVEPSTDHSPTQED
ncbi:conserved hypothetical protein [metagenome]|uniref:Uncharacterized protein n=1 Tax=metagenome TaxID=256318 RepID=A0A2P2C5U8_9ZZZZ